MSFQLAIFDLAGTTVKDNRDVHRVLQKTLMNHDVEITIEQANAVMGIPKPVAIRELLIDKNIDPAEEFIAVLHQEFIAEMISFYERDSSVGEKPGVSETFLALSQRGIKVAVNTGFDRNITTALLSRLGGDRDGLVDFSISSDEVVRGRPYPDMIIKLMSKAAVRYPSQVIKVGDTASDIEEGRSAGCGLVVAVTTGAFSQAELKVSRPDEFIEQLPELLAILDRS